MRCSVPEFWIFAGMTCAIRLLPGIEKQEHLRTNYNVWEAGKRNPWWSVMRTLHQRDYRVPHTG